MPPGDRLSRKAGSARRGAGTGLGGSTISPARQSMSFRRSAAISAAATRGGEQDQDGVTTRQRGTGRADAGAVVVAAGAVALQNWRVRPRVRAAGRGLPPGRLQNASAAAHAVWVGGADSDDPG